MRFIASINTRFYGVYRPQGAEVDVSDWTRKQLLQFLNKGLIQASQITAGAITDALEFEGPNVSVTELLGKLVVTIGTPSFADLTDVDMSTPPTDGQVALWDEDSGTWKPGTILPEEAGLDPEEIMDLLAGRLIPGANVDLVYADEPAGTITISATTATPEIDDVVGLTAALAAKSAVGHTHTSAAITDFTEAVQDVVGAALVGSGVTVTYDDTAGQVTITGAGSTDLEAVRDAIGVALVGLGVISVAVDDALNTITITSSATANSTDASLRDRSTHTGVQPQSSITDLVTDLAGKASTSHTHTVRGSKEYSWGGDATVNTGTMRLYNDDGVTRTITSVRVSAGTAPVGAALVVNPKKGGTTIFPTTAKPQCAAGANTGTAVPDTTAWANGEYLTFDFTAIGTTAAKDITVQVNYTIPA